MLSPKGIRICWLRPKVRMGSSHARIRICGPVRRFQPALSKVLAKNEAARAPDSKNGGGQWREIQRGLGRVKVVRSEDPGAIGREVLTAKAQHLELPLKAAPTAKAAALVEIGRAPEVLIVRR